MGKQSARIYFQGKDHKEIYYQGHYHKAMYIGSQLVWEKIEDAKAQEIYLEYLIYGNGLYVGCDYYYPGTNKTVGIYTGKDLENMHLVCELNKSNIWYRGISIFINNVYSLITRCNGIYHWHTWLLSEGNISAKTYSHNNISFPIIIDLSALSQVSDLVVSTGARAAAIIRDKMYIPNNSGFNGVSYDKGVESINDVFLKDGIVWGASSTVHAEENVEYLYQYFYSIDENDNISRTEMRFPNEATDAVKAQVIKDVKKQLQDKDNGYILTDIKIYESALVFICNDCNENGFIYTINDKMHRYAEARLKCKIQAISSDGKKNYENERIQFFAFYWKIDLNNLKVIEYDTHSLDYPHNGTKFFRPKWDMPAIGEIWSKYETNEFTIYEIKEAIQESPPFGGPTYTWVTHLIYNLKSEGDATHKIYLEDVKDTNKVIGNICSNTPVLIHAAFLKEDNLYIDITKSTQNSSGANIKHPKAFLKINIITNEGETIIMPTARYLTD